MSTLKVYFGGHLFVSQVWRDALGVPAHVQQCDVIGVAATKAALTDMLTERAPYGGDRFVKDMRVARWYSTSMRMLIDAGTIDLTQPGVYVMRDAVKDHSVIRVDPDGTCVTVAWFRLPKPGGPLTVELEA